MSSSSSSTVPPGRKIIDVIQDAVAAGHATSTAPLISLEYFPPRTQEGVENLYVRMERMKQAIQPIFTDVTWGAGGSTADLSMEMALHMHRTGHTANLHMTCTNLTPAAAVTEGEATPSTPVVSPKEAIRNALVTAHAGGIRNIVALRGDPPAGQQEWTATEGGFTCALDLVKFMRTEMEPAAMRSEWCIAVAGYPEGHPNAIMNLTANRCGLFDTLTPAEQARCSISPENGDLFCCLDQDYEKELLYLKQKVDAGADYIITQMFFDTTVFVNFVKDCRAVGIKCPIVPGLMCINTYAGFVKMTKFCKTRVPEGLLERMEAIKDDADAMKAFGIEFGAQQCRDILATNDVHVLHFYTLNLEKVVYGILQELGVGTSSLLSMVNEDDAATQVAKGSAWARVGDVVSSIYGKGSVTSMNADTGAATISIDSWLLAGGQKPVAYLQQGAYSKVFS